jgi:hypothetical protein
MMKLFLWLLDKFFQLIRKKPNPGYPYDKKTRQIKLPLHIEKEIRELGRRGEKVQAVKKVTQLTGAGLRISKDYVDQFEAKTGK